ncbi:formylglycine-generating enzyme required for sulfatase activity [Rhizobium petrolearium]|uniref:formylglycine-generating enzyme family protein n=1 Tax=Neorhizobium petrolearium TaxID=515361 RepID=UPI001AE44042|nr:SUMF1/EgtB/PvdO family nonheme iron enzyme [Neorhizobium petrolearium]MBP1845473.1 formylglycine-generating enzyme required for sulfatase activity [Neorhizobium petrolearium]
MLNAWKIGRTKKAVSLLCLLPAFFLPLPPSIAAELDPLSTFEGCERCPEMVVIPPGSFLMGASERDIELLGFSDWIVPQHRVEIAYAFALGRFEVTVDEFAAYVAETQAKVGGNCAIRMAESGEWGMKYQGTLHPKSDEARDSAFFVFITDGSYAQPGLPVTGKQPAVCVSRQEISDYLDWLSDRTGQRYRLPTEAEWEYAYRAGTETFAYWGDDLSRTCDFANFADRKSGYQMGLAARCAEKKSLVWTADVGSFQPNAWGLHDMAGNVQEIVEDCLHVSYDGAPTDGSPWAEDDCFVFVARGGDYAHPSYGMGAAPRELLGFVEGPGSPGPVWEKDTAWSVRANVVGFRVAVSLDDRSWDRQ